MKKDRFKKSKSIEEIINYEITLKIAKLLLGNDKQYGFEFVKEFRDFILNKYKELGTCVLYALSSEDFFIFLARYGFSKEDLKKRELVICKRNILYTSDFRRKPEEIDL